MYDNIPDVEPMSRWAKAKTQMYLIFLTIWCFICNRIYKRRLPMEPGWLYTAREIEQSLAKGETGASLLAKASLKDLSPELRHDLTKYIK